MTKMNRRTQSNSHLGVATPRCHFLPRAGIVALGSALLMFCAVSYDGFLSSTAAQGLPAIKAPHPMAQDVHVMLTAGYQSPERHEVAELVEEGRAATVIVWTRRYDGIEMLNQPRSALVDGQWVLRHHRELAEPKPPKMAEVIATDVAINATGFTDLDGVNTRLVYWPEFRQVARVAEPRTAADIEDVIADYRLAVEVTHSPDVAWIDAYTAQVLERGSSRRHVKVDALGARYAPVELDIQARAPFDVLRDPQRTSLLDANNTPINGQGVVTNRPANANSPLPYFTVTQADPRYIDGAFALQQSWEFYAGAFGRRGLRNLPQAQTSRANDGIIYLDDRSHDNAEMDTATGLIVVYTGGNAPFDHFLTLEVIGHEWTHAVFAADAHPPTASNGQHAGLDEATSYFFGSLIRERGQEVALRKYVCSVDPAHCDHSVVPPIVPLGNTTDSWKFGQEYAQAPANSMYHMCKPSQSTLDPPLPIDEWSPANTLADGHVLAGPINRMQCLLTLGVLPVDSQGGDPVLKTPNVPNGFAGLGTQKTAMLWYFTINNLRAYEPPLTFDNAREAALQAVAELPGSGGKHSMDYKAVEDAFAAVLIGDPADREPPLVRLFWPAAVRSGAMMEVDARDNNGVASLAFYLDGGPSTTPPGTPIGTLTAPPSGALLPPHFVTLPQTLTEGPHTLYVVAEDTRQNRKAYSFPFAADQTPPTVTITDKSPIFSSERSPMRVFDFNAFDDRGIKKARVLVDGVDSTYPASANLGLPGAALYTYNGATNINQPAEWVSLQGASVGPHVVAVEVTDIAGNTATAALPPWTRDVTPPSLCTISVTRGSPWSSVNIAASAKDLESSIATVKYKVDNNTVWSEIGITTAPGATFSKTINTTLQAPGSHTFTAQCIDHQGNNIPSFPVTLAFGPPPSCALTAAVDPANWARVIMSSTASSPYLTLDQVRYDVDGANFVGDMGLARGPGVVYQGSRTTGVLTAGTHNFQERCIDSLGQTTTSNIVSKTLSAPAAPCNAPNSDLEGHFYAVFETGNDGVPKTQYFEMGRASGHFHWTYGWLANASSYTITCAVGGTINGSTSYSTGCVHYPIGTFPNLITQGDQTVSFNCNSGRIQLVTNQACDEGSWNSELWCAVP